MLLPAGLPASFNTFQKLVQPKESNLCGNLECGAMALTHPMLHKLGGPPGNRTPTKGLQSPCAPIITSSPINLCKAHCPRIERGKHGCPCCGSNHICLYFAFMCFTKMTYNLSYYTPHVRESFGKGIKNRT